MDNIAETIYKSCDPNNTDLVLVSSLLDFIKPFLSNNEKELIALKVELDPNNVDPTVNFSFFQITMAKWIAGIEAHDLNTSLADISSNINISTKSCVSPNVICEGKYVPNNNNSISLEEENESLKYQLNKANNEIHLLKLQIQTCEEQNESLVGDLNRCLVLHNNGSPEINQNLNTEDGDSINDEINILKRKCQQLEKLVNTANKNEELFLSQIQELENENTRLNHRLENFEKSKRRERKSIGDMLENLETKDSEINTLIETIESLKCDLGEKSELLEFYTKEHELLKNRNRNLEDRYRLRKLNFNETPFKNDSEYNTPNLLRQLSCPVSPTLIETPQASVKSSTPLRNNSKAFDSSLFENSCISLTQSPHKNLKDEFDEIFEEFKENAVVNHQVEAKITLKNNNNIQVSHEEKVSLKFVDKECNTENEFFFKGVNRRTNYSKQQIRIERLIEEKERLQTEWLAEKTLNNQLTLEVNEKHHVITNLENEISKLKLSLNCSQNEVTTIKTICSNLEHTFNDTSHHLTMEQHVNRNILHHNDMLILKIRQLEDLLKKSSLDNSDMGKTESIDLTNSDITAVRNLSSLNQTNDEDVSFMTAQDDLSCYAQDIPEIMPLLNTDYFLYKVKTNKIGDLSRGEMDEQFATLALMLTLDFGTLEKTINIQRESFEKNAINFHSHLNYSIHLLKSSSSKKYPNYNVILSQLESLKNMSEGFLRMAITCAILEYKKQTSMSWNFVINYVAILRKSQRCSNELTIKTYSPISCCDNGTPKNKSSKIKCNTGCCIYTFLFLIFAVIIFILYIDSFCPKNSKRVCPLQSLISLFVKKTYSVTI